MQKPKAQAIPRIATGQVRSQIIERYLTAQCDGLACCSASLFSIGTLCNACCARVLKVTQPSKSVQLRFHRSEVSKDDKVLRLSSDQQQGAKEQPWRVKRGAMT